MPLLRRPLSLGLIALAALTGCSAGTSNNATQVDIAVTGASSARLGSTVQFGAVVTGSTNTAVSWEVDGVLGGSAAYGTISVAGLYTAPATMPSSAMVTITAISTASASASGSVSESL